MAIIYFQMDWDRGLIALQSHFGRTLIPTNTSRKCETAVKKLEKLSRRMSAKRRHHPVFKTPKWCTRLRSLEGIRSLKEFKSFGCKRVVRNDYLERHRICIAAGNFPLESLQCKPLMLWVSRVCRHSERSKHSASYRFCCVDSVAQKALENFRVETMIIIKCTVCLRKLLALSEQTHKAHQEAASDLKRNRECCCLQITRSLFGALIVLRVTVPQTFFTPSALRDSRAASRMPTVNQQRTSGNEPAATNQQQNECNLVSEGPELRAPKSQEGSAGTNHHQWSCLGESDLKSS